jgi:hypothetical protein
MRLVNGVRSLVVLALATTPNGWSWAQVSGTAPAAPLSGEATATSGWVIAALLLVVAFIVIIAKISDLREKREEEGTAIQSKISDALLADPTLARLPVAVTVHIPLTRHASLLADVRGDVPSQALRATVIRLVQRELDQHSPSSTIEDRLMVIPLGHVHAA